MVVLPASLKGNFRNELRSLCAGEEYITANERKQLAELHPSDDKYKEIIEKILERQASMVVFNVFTPDADRFGKDKIFQGFLM